VLTGGRSLLQQAGDRPDRLTIDDLGRARQVWATASRFGILGGRGDRAAIRRRLSAARAELAQCDDETIRPRILERIGKLSGAGAVVRVAAPTDTARAELRLRVEAAIQAAGQALETGVVAGGGAALVGCAGAVAALELPAEERIGARILARAMTAPMRAIASNAGFEPAPLVAEARRRGPGWAFDVVRGSWVEAHRVGLVDPLSVVQTALETGAGGAAIGLTTEVLVRRRDLLAKLRR
jgi:chaperonin GroEL